MKNLMKINKEFEQKVIASIVAGEITLFPLLVNTFHTQLYNVGRVYGYTHKDARELIRNTFVGSYQNLEKKERKFSFKVWIIRLMLKNCDRKKMEKIRNIKWRIIDGWEDNLDENFTVAKESSPDFLKILDGLPLDYRLVFTLKEILEMNTLETAEILDISSFKVRVRLYKAKKTIKERFGSSSYPKKLYSLKKENSFLVEEIMSQIAQIRLNPDNLSQN